jgi:hypothetical protein
MIFEKANQAFLPQHPIPFSHGFEPSASSSGFSIWGRNGFDGDKEVQAAYRASCQLVNPVGL